MSALFVKGAINQPLCRV